MKVLVTGFDPFGGESVNPAYQAVKRLPEVIAGAQVIKVEIPTSFRRSVVEIEKYVDEYQPDLIINVGQAGGRSCTTIEKVAINLAEARIPDNDGYQPEGVKLQPNGENAYFTQLPVNAIVEQVRSHGLPCHVSYSAGSYVCNSVMYQVLYLTHTKYPNIRGGFIHVPYACQQVVDKPNGTPSMSLADISKTLEYAIEAAVKNPKDIAGEENGTIQ